MANVIDYNGIRTQQGSSPKVLFDKQLNFYSGDVIVFAPCLAVRCYAAGQLIWGYGESQVIVSYGSKDSQGTLIWNKVKELHIKATGGSSKAWTDFFSINNTINGTDSVDAESNIFKLSITSNISADGNKAYTQFIGYAMNAMSESSYTSLAKWKPILGCDCYFYTIGSGRDYETIEACIAAHQPGVYSGSRILASDDKRVGFGFKL